MTPLRYTFIGDGSSDACLTHVINWALSRIASIRRRGFIEQVADLRYMPAPPGTLHERLQEALRLYPCELLVVHRDAEREAHDVRVTEIEAAADDLGLDCFVPVVPVRMTEAWLLIDERALRLAASNPNGKIGIEVPGIFELEEIPNPKKVLYEILERASEKRGRRLDQFRRRIPSSVHRVAELISDFSPLRSLPAFQAFENELERQVARIPNL